MHLIGPLLCEEHLLALLGAATLSAKRKVQDGFECNEKTLHTHFREAETCRRSARQRRTAAHFAPSLELLQFGFI